MVRARIILSRLEIGKKCSWRSKVMDVYDLYYIPACLSGVGLRKTSRCGRPIHSDDN
jgi:hypothetical protein